MQSRIYYQGAEKPKNINQENLRLLLWPVFVSKVYVPNPQGIQINIFEKAILQLIQASNGIYCNEEDIAIWLGIDLEMVKYIIHARFIPNGWLKDNRTLTDKGKQYLQDAPLASSITARVYQCAITGEWLPRLGFDVKSLEGEEKQYETRFTLSRGSDYYDKGYLLNPIRKAGDIPSKEQLLGISSQFFRDLRTAKATREDFDEFYESFENTSIRYEDSPFELAYLLVWVERSATYALHVHDHFGISTRASWMKNLFEQVCRNNSKITDLFLDNTERDKNLTFAQVKAQHEETAKFEMIANYPQISPEHQLYDTVLEFQQSYSAVNSSLEDGTRAYRSLLVIAGATLEAVCKYIVNSYPLRNRHELPCWKTPIKTKTEYYKKRLSDVGLKQGQIQKVLKVRVDNIRNAAEGKNSSCRALLAVSFLSANDFAGHPMHLLKRNSSLFESLYDLSYLRDQAAHGETDNDGRVIKFKKSNSLNAAKSLSQFLKLIFKGNYRGQEK